MEWETKVVMERRWTPMMRMVKLEDLRFNALTVSFSSLLTRNLVIDSFPSFLQSNRTFSLSFTLYPFLFPLFPRRIPHLAISHTLSLFSPFQVTSYCLICIVGPTFFSLPLFFLPTHSRVCKYRLPRLSSLFLHPFRETQSSVHFLSSP